MIHILGKNSDDSVTIQTIKLSLRDWFSVVRATMENVPSNSWCYVGKRNFKLKTRMRRLLANENVSTELIKDHAIIGYISLRDKTCRHTSYAKAVDIKGYSNTSAWVKFEPDENEPDKDPEVFDKILQ